MIRQVCPIIGASLSNLRADSIWPSGDQSFAHMGTVEMAYQTTRIGLLAFYNPELTVKNAGTLRQMPLVDV